MKKLTEEILGHTLTSEEVVVVLKKLHLDVPEQMIDYYLVNNNQTYFEKYFVLYNDNVLNEIFKVRGWFCMVANNEVDNLLNLSFEDNYRHSREFLPNHLTPFAYNDMDDYYVISNKLEDYGSIYFIRNDMFYEESGAIKLLSESIEKFVNELITNEKLIEMGID